VSANVREERVRLYLTLIFAQQLTMSEKFQLFYSAQSPYVRKVVIAARLLGLNDRVERIKTQTSEVTPPTDLISANPLGKVNLLPMAKHTEMVDSPILDQPGPYVGRKRLFRI
jgi:hypothetical protein